MRKKTSLLLALLMAVATMIDTELLKPKQPEKKAFYFSLEKSPVNILR